MDISVTGASGSRQSTSAPRFLSTARGKLTLTLLCAVAFLDFVDASIVNIALPDIRSELDFSVQELQWVPSALPRSPTAVSCCSAVASPTCSVAVACSSPAPS